MAHYVIHHYLWLGMAHCSGRFCSWYSDYAFINKVIHISLTSFYGLFLLFSLVFSVSLPFPRLHILTLHHLTLFLLSVNLFQIPWSDAAVWWGTIQHGWTQFQAIDWWLVCLEGVHKTDTLLADFNEFNSLILTCHDHHIVVFHSKVDEWLRCTYPFQMLSVDPWQPIKMDTTTTQLNYQPIWGGQ